MSIKPKYCELIANGKKTVEVRKTKPKIDVPFKVYIYCTKGEGYMYRTRLDENRVGVAEIWNGKVIGEFVCDKIENFRYDALEMTYFARKYQDANLLNEEFFTGTQVTYQEAYDYCEGMTFGEEDTDYFYGWHISNLVIYDKPKELSEFKTECKEWDKDNPYCDDCKYFIDCRGYEYDESDCACDGLKPVERPPQSYMFVEELGVLDTYHSVPEQIPCSASCNKDCGECFKEWLQEECE